MEHVRQELALSATRWNTLDELKQSNA